MALTIAVVSVGRTAVLAGLEKPPANGRDRWALDPGNTRLWLELGLLAAAELDDPALAATCFGRVLALEPEHPKASLLHGFIEARR